MVFVSERQEKNHPAGIFAEDYKLSASRICKLFQGKQHWRNLLSAFLFPSNTKVLCLHSITKGGLIITV